MVRLQVNQHERLKLGRFEFEFEFEFLEPCAVKAGPLPPNVNTGQNAAMKWMKLKLSSQTVTLQ
jgi:hypothetical protein